MNEVEKRDIADRLEELIQQTTHNFSRLSELMQEEARKLEILRDMQDLIR